MPAVDGPFPNSAQELLLRAALLNKESALPAWKQWRSMLDFERDVDSGSQRLLPLAYWNLRSFDYTDELMEGRVKGVYRRYWLENKKLFYEAGQVIERLHSVGIKTAVLKGIALSALVYENDGVRPMADVDILVPIKNARQTVKILKKSGYTVKTGGLMEKLEFGKSIPLVSPNNIEIDLHWHVMLHSRSVDITQDFWNHTQPIEIAGIKTLTLSATDNLLHTLVHGVGRNPESPVRWVSDAITILTSESQRVDWLRLLGISEKLGVSLHLKESFLYLENSFGITIPAAVTARLRSHRPSYAERVVFRHAVRVGGVGSEGSLHRRLFAFYARYLSRAKSRRFLPAHFGLLHYTVKRLKVRMLARPINI